MNIGLENRQNGRIPALCDKGHRLVVSRRRGEPYEQLLRGQASEWILVQTKDWEERRSNVPAIQEVLEFWRIERRKRLQRLVDNDVIELPEPSI